MTQTSVNQLFVGFDALGPSQLYCCHVKLSPKRTGERKDRQKRHQETRKNVYYSVPFAKI